MKRELKMIFICMILTIILLGTNVTISFGTERLVDIPVPPNSSGYADFSPEDGDEREKQYEEQKKNENKANELSEKTSNIENKDIEETEDKIEKNNNETEKDENDKTKEKVENNSEKIEDKKDFKMNKTIMTSIPVAICIAIMLVVSIYKEKKHKKHSR